MEWRDYFKQVSKSYYIIIVLFCFFPFDFLFLIQFQFSSQSLFFFFQFSFYCLTMFSCSFFSLLGLVFLIIIVLRTYIWGQI